MDVKNSSSAGEFNSFMSDPEMIDILGNPNLVALINSSDMNLI
ncbi:MAG: hypothetical protein QXZ17_05025 [Nitrososphaerota archaeon]